MVLKMQDVKNKKRPSLEKRHILSEVSTRRTAVHCLQSSRSWHKETELQQSPESSENSAEDRFDFTVPNNGSGEKFDRDIWNDGEGPPGFHVQERSTHKV